MMDSGLKNKADKPGEDRSSVFSTFPDSQQPYMEEREHLQVYLRIRPFTSAESSNGESQDCVTIESPDSVLLKPPGLSHSARLSADKSLPQTGQRFQFSRVYGPETTQRDLFEGTVQDLVKDVLEGGNSLVFTYGISNAGKTFTFLGPDADVGLLPRSLDAVFSSIGDKVFPGMSVRPHRCREFTRLGREQQAEEAAFKRNLFRQLKESERSNASLLNSTNKSLLEGKIIETEDRIRLELEANTKFSVWVSFCEIYNENVHDLLEAAPSGAPRRAALRLSQDVKGNAFIKDLRWVQVNSAEEAFTVMKLGKKNQSFSSTRLNCVSSRSHSIFSIRILKIEDVGSLRVHAVSELCLCDLAGSERCAKTQNKGERLKEAGNINTSLLILGKCINALRHNQQAKLLQHVPFRESKLTHYLQGFFCGRGKACMIVNVNQCASVYDETLNVLKFSAVAQKVVVLTSRPLPIMPQRSDRDESFVLNNTERKTLRSSRRRSSLIGWESSLEDVQEDEDDEYEEEQSLMEDTTNEGGGDENDDKILVCQKTHQRQVALLKQLQVQLKKERAESLLMEAQVREEISREFSELFSEMQNDYNDRLAREREILEERAERRMEIFKNLIDKMAAGPSRDAQAMDILLDSYSSELAGIKNSTEAHKHNGEARGSEDEEKRRLLSQIQEKSSEVSRLEEQVGDLQRKVELSSRGRCSPVEERRSREREQLQEAVAALEKEKRAKEETLAALEYQTVGKEEALASLEDERRAREEAVASLGELKQSKQEMLASLEEERKDKDEAKVALEAERRTREDVMATLEAERRTREDVMATLETERRTREDVMATLEAERRTREDIVATLEAERRTREDIMVTLEAERRTREDVVATLETERRTREDVMATLEAERRTREDVEATLETERRTREDVMATLEAERRTREDVMVTLEAERRTKEDVEATLEAERRTREDVMATLAEEKQSQEEVHYALEEMSRLVEERGEREQKGDALRQELTEKLEATQQQVSSKTEEAEQAFARLGAAQEQLDKRSSLIATLTQEVHRLKQEAQTSAGSGGVSDPLREEVSELRRNLAEEEEKTESERRRVTELQDELAQIKRESAHKRLISDQQQETLNQKEAASKQEVEELRVKLQEQEEASRRPLDELRSRLERQERAAKEEMDELRAKLQASEQLNESSLQQLEEFKRKPSEQEATKKLSEELREKLSEQEGAAERLRDELEAAKVKCSSSSEAEERLRRLNSDLQTEVASLRTKVSTLEETPASARREEELRKQLLEKEAQVTSLQKSLQEAQERREEEECRAVQEARRREAERRRELLAVAHEAIAQKDEELQKRAEEISSLEENAKQDCEKMKSLNVDLQRREDDSSDLREKLADYKKQIQQVQKEISAMREEEKLLKQKLSDVEKTKKQLQSDVGCRDRTIQQLKVEQSSSTKSAESLLLYQKACKDLEAKERVMEDMRSALMEQEETQEQMEQVLEEKRDVIQELSAEVEKLKGMLLQRDRGNNARKQVDNPSHDLTLAKQEAAKAQESLKTYTDKHQAERKRWQEEKLSLIGQAKEAEDKRNQEMRKFADDRERYARQHGQLECQLSEKEQTMDKWRMERDALVSALEVQLHKLLSSQADKDKLIQQLRRSNTRPPQEAGNRGDGGPSVSELQAALSEKEAEILRLTEELKASAVTQTRANQSPAALVGKTTSETVNRTTGRRDTRASVSSQSSAGCPSVLDSSEISTENGRASRFPRPELEISFSPLQPNRMALRRQGETSAVTVKITRSARKRKSGEMEKCHIFRRSKRQTTRQEEVEAENRRNTRAKLTPKRTQRHEESSSPAGRHDSQSSVQGRKEGTLQKIGDFLQSSPTLLGSKAKKMMSLVSGRSDADSAAASSSSSSPSSSLRAKKNKKKLYRPEISSPMDMPPHPIISREPEEKESDHQIIKWRLRSRMAN
ncbi:kinesin-like protein KIF20B [Brachyistius frenatus]|uniref:kinesin-like protein KIF20B n=1 Tax=Brachyistius frenatus TaxID=100188 RepID=UPI0037E7621C